MSGSAAHTLDHKSPSPFPWLELLLFVGVIYRVLGMRGALWLDELWALEWARSLPDVKAIFTGYYSENNHFLQSAWLFVVQESGSSVVHRLFSFACSVSLLGLLYIHAKQKGGYYRWLFVLIATSYVFVLYGTEARGYSPMLLALYLVYVSSQRLLTSQSLWSVFLFWFACLLAASTHVGSLIFIAACLIGCIPRLGWGRAIGIGIFPCALALLLWIGFISKVKEGSGAIGNEWFALSNLLSVGVGGPAVSISTLGLVSFLVAIAVGVWLLRLLVIWTKRGGMQREFFLAGIVFLPILGWALYRPDHLYARHFLPSLFIGYIFLAHLLEEVFSGSQQPSRLMSLSFLALFVVGNAVHVLSLAHYGRGGYEEIVKRISVANGAIASDIPFRHESMLRYHAARLGVSLSVLDADKRSANTPEWARLPVSPQEGEAVACWYLSVNEPIVAAPQISERYVFVEFYPSAALSGWGVSLFSHQQCQSDSSGGSDPTRHES